jgi:hypothetical protein
MMSWIEKQAFSVLLRQETASIKDMRPVDVPANQFSYHLNNLIQQKYIQKIDRGKYTLTPLGLQFAGKLSTATNEQRDNMKTVIILYGKTDDGRVSLFEWSRQPYIHKMTLPHDRMAYSDSLDAAVTTACMDKLGKKVNIRYKTSVIMTITHQHQIVSRMHGLVYLFDPNNVTHPYHGRNGTLVLAKPEERSALMDGVLEFIQQLEVQTDNTPLEVSLNY